MNTWFKKIFKRKKVNLNIVKQAIFDYRNEGKKLMDELGKKYNLDINNHENYIQLSMLLLFSPSTKCSNSRRQISH